MQDTTIVRTGEVNPIDLESGKQVVFLLSDGHSTCAFLSREEFQGNVMLIIDESRENLDVIGDEWTISTALMSKKQIDEIEEFTGF